MSRPCGAVLVSTVAAGNVAAYVGESDLVMMPSVVDVAGLNSVSTVVLDAAAGAIDGMARSRDRRTRLGNGASIKPAVGLTMFGVTTPCVEAVRASLESRGLDPLVFHATGECRVRRAPSSSDRIGYDILPTPKKTEKESLANSTLFVRFPSQAREAEPWRASFDRQ